MSVIGKITTGDAFENVEGKTQEMPHGLSEYSLTELAPADRNNSTFLNHKNPELQAVISQSEILNVSHRELTPDAIDDSFLQAQSALVDHFAMKLSALPDDVRDSFLKSLDLESHYKPSFPLHSQILKSSFA